MKRYSEFFNTLYDDNSPVYSSGSGVHYSILRALVWVPWMKFHDFSIIWDEDHDQRIIWVIEQLYVRLLLHNVLFIGERDTHVTILTSDPVASDFEEGVREICGKVSSYCSKVSVDPFRRGCGCITNDPDDQVATYLSGIDAIWSLGTREAVFSPHGVPDAGLSPSDT